MKKKGAREDILRNGDNNYKYFPHREIVYKHDVWDLDILQKTSDVKYKVEDKIYYLHNVILCMSEFLCNLSYGKFAETEHDIKILDFIDKETWENVLRYMYGLTNIANIYDNENIYVFDISKISYENLAKLKQAADFLLLSKLSEECISNMKIYIKQYIKNYEILAELYNSMDETLIYYMIKLIRSKLDTIDIIKLANYFYNNPNTDMSNDKFLWKSIQDYMYKTLYDDLGYKTKFVLDENYFENILLLSRIIITLLK